jgi:ribosomal protein S18 acetylase RimI-like enzyme
VTSSLDVVTDPDQLDDRSIRDVMNLVADLVSAGAALGWIDPPSTAEIGELLRAVAGDVEFGDAALALARADGSVVGFGYWRRYARPTHHPHVDIERMAVRADQQRRGVGRALTTTLLVEAKTADVEQVTLDLRGDNAAALSLYESLGFRVYGRLTDFVAVGTKRYDKVLCVLDLRGDPT